jgi:hypothetical protein
MMSQAIEQVVKSKYGAAATSGLSTDHDGVRAVAEAFGNSPQELASIPFIDLLRRSNVNDYAASVRVFAVKPAR